MSAGWNIRDLSVAYGAAKVIDDLSLDIAPGCFVALIGPNGSGKSTLLKALAGLLAYDGRITLHDREIRSYSKRELARNVGMLPQKIRTDASMTVYDLIGLGRMPFEGLFHMRKPEEELALLEAAGAMQLDDLLFKSVSRISGGESQRALIAMLLAQDPDVFLLDEPSSATDTKHSVAIFSLFRKMADAGRTVLAAVHDINLAMRFADRVIALKNGRILHDVPVAMLDGDILRDLYDIAFDCFLSQNDVKAWHASTAGGQ